MKISLSRYISLLMSLIVVCTSLTAALLWHADRLAVKTTQELTHAAESMATAQSIQQNLNIHHRQALLRGLRSITDRRRQIELSRQNLLQSMNDAVKFTYSPKIEILTQEVQKNLDLYLSEFENFRSSGVHSIQLYESVSDQYYKTQVAIQALIDSNLKQTLELQNDVFHERRIDLFFLSLATFLLICVLSFFFWGLRRILYLPLIHLQKNIENFEVGNKSAIESVKGATEVESIAWSFNQLAEKLARQKDQQLNFLSSIAHDLKNPLGAIKMSAEILKKDALSEQAKHMLSILGRQTDHMHRLIEDLMDTTRIEAGQMELILESFDLRKIIADCIDLHSNLSTKHFIRCEFPNQALIVLCDQHRLTQVFNNLFNNAIKYSPNGGEIKVLINTSGEFVKIQISDSGVGILDQDISGVFEPFRRSSTTKNTIPGVGLGLSVSRKIIRAHQNGDITVSSQYGKGSTFSVQLKLKDLISVSENISSPNL